MNSYSNGREVLIHFQTAMNSESSDHGGNEIQGKLFRNQFQTMSDVLDPFVCVFHLTRM